MSLIMSCEKYRQLIKEHDVCARAKHLLLLLGILLLRFARWTKTVTPESGVILAWEDEARAAQSTGVLVNHLKCHHNPRAKRYFICVFITSSYKFSNSTVLYQSNVCFPPTFTQLRARARKYKICSVRVKDCWEIGLKFRCVLIE